MEDVATQALVVGVGNFLSFSEILSELIKEVPLFLVIRLIIQRRQDLAQTLLIPFPFFEILLIKLLPEQLLRFISAILVHREDEVRLHVSQQNPSSLEPEVLGQHLLHILHKII